MSLGSIPYYSALNALLEDNSNLFYDSVNKRIGIGIFNPADLLHLERQGEAGLVIENSSRGLHSKNWRIGSNGDSFDIQSLSDAYVNLVSALKIDRSAGVPTISRFSTGLKLGSIGITPEAGMLRWDGLEFQGYDGFNWLVLNGAASQIFRPWKTVDNLIYTTEAQAVTAIGSDNGIVYLPSDYVGALAADATIPENVTVIDARRTRPVIGNISPYNPNISFDLFPGSGNNPVFGTGFQIRTTGGGTSGNPATGESVALFAGANRPVGDRPIWAFNSVTQITTKTNYAIGNEIDINNNSGIDAGLTGIVSDQIIGQFILSGGLNKAGVAIRIGNTGIAANRWRSGLDITSYDLIGIRVTQDSTVTPLVTGPAIYLIPSSNGISPLMGVRYPNDSGGSNPTGNVWEVLQNGTQVIDNNLQLQMLDVARTGYSKFFVGADSVLRLLTSPTNVGILGLNDNTSILSWDVGGITVAGNIVGTNLIMNTATGLTSAGQLGLGTSTAATASAGGGQAALATVLGYWVINIAGTNVKIPYFAN